MGTYYSIAGNVKLDAAAWQAFTTLTSADWIDSEAEAGGEGFGATVTSAGAAIELGGVFRNLGRHLEWDLAMAALVGDVTGSVTVACTDGTNECSVTRFLGRGQVLHGGTECLSTATVDGAWVVPAVVPMGGYGFPVLQELRGDDGVPTMALAAEVPYTEMCGCGGWDEEEEVPVCTGPHQPGVRQGGPVATGATLGRLRDVLAGAPAATGEHEALRALAATIAHAGGRRTGLTGGGAHDDGTVAVWAAAVVGAPLPDGYEAHATNNQELQAALAARGVDGRPGDPLTAAELGAVFPEGRPAWTASQWLGGHPNLTWELACSLSLAAFCGPDLARNEALADDDVLTLSGRVVAEAAPWRFGDDELVHDTAARLGAGWEGDGLTLRDTVLAALAPRENVTA